MASFIPDFSKIQKKPRLVRDFSKDFSKAHAQDCLRVTVSDSLISQCTCMHLHHHANVVSMASNKDCKIIVC